MSDLRLATVVIIDRIAFTVQGRAAPQGSKRALGRGVMVESSKRVKPWREDVRMVAGLAMTGDPWGGPIALEVAFDFRRPASHFLTDGITLSSIGRRALYPGRRGDGDKLLRAVMDALTGIVFHDDDQVTAIYATKGWGPRDEARVSVRRLVGATWTEAA